MPAHAIAVGYTRRSTEKQEASIAEQTEFIRQYADEKGYEIVRWYTDDAVSGDDTENRHGFQRMLADAQTRRDFQVVLCWDQSRFGRFSPQEAGHWTYLFSKAGIRLVTTDKGPVDWNDFTGWLTYSVDQHAKHQFLRNLSRDVTRGHLEAAKKGSWIGSPPYGYRIEGERKNKRLVVDSQGKVKVVRRIFREYVEEGRTLADIARRLEHDRIVSPNARGKRWRFDTVRVILENPAYVGDYASGRRSYGKYHTVRGGQVAEGSGGRGRTKNPKAQWTVRRDTHEAIIDRDTFERAQAILERGKTGRSGYTPEENPFVLSGLLRCGKCGSPMWGDKAPRRGNAALVYECGNWQYNGTEHCEGTKVRESEVLSGVAEHLENWLGLECLDDAAYYGTLKPDDMPEAFELVRKLVMPPTRPKRSAAKLTTEVETLRAKLVRARANLVLLDADNIPAAQERIEELAGELEAAEKELQATSPPAERDVNAVALSVLHNLYSLAYCCRALARPLSERKLRRGSLEAKAPQAVRRFLSHASHIECHTTKSGTGTGTRHKFVRGEIVFREVGVNTGGSNPRLPVVTRVPSAVRPRGREYRPAAPPEGSRRTRVTS